MTEISGNNDSPKLLSDSDGNNISANFPLQVDGDSIYSKDINVALSNIGDFSGDILTLFNDYETEIIDATATNPKILIIHLLRPIKSNQIGIGSKTGDFSNVLIKLKDLAGTVRTVIDDSASNTKHSSNVYAFTTNVFVEIVIEFHTVDTVTLSGMYVPKVQSRAISAIDGFISAKNSSLIPLGIGGIFQGEAENSRDYGAIQIAFFSDQACTFLIEGRATPTSVWREIDTYLVAAGEDKAWSFQGVRQFIRVTITNGAIAQGVNGMDLQTMFKPVYIKPSSHPMGGLLKSNDDAEAVKAGIAGFSIVDGEPENVATFRQALQVDSALVHRVGVNELFRQLTGVNTTLATATSADDYMIDLVSVVGLTDVAPGSQIEINGERYHFHVTNITGNIVTLDRRMDNAHPIGAAVVEIITDMNVDGTLAAPEIFIVAPPSDEIWQITRVNTNLTASTAMDDGKFGGRVVLPFGFVLRANRDGQWVTGTIWKSNGDMALDQYDLTYTDKAPAGENGLRGRWTFTKAEFIVELDGATGDYLAAYVQDALSSQSGFNLKAQGRVFGG